MSTDLQTVLSALFETDKKILLALDGLMYSFNNVFGDFHELNKDEHKDENEEKPGKTGSNDGDD